MNTFTRFLAGVACSLTLCLTVTAQADSSSALDIPLNTMSGMKKSLNEISDGKPTYLKLWATWCKTCIEQMAHFEKTHQKYKDELSVVAINVWLNDSESAIKQTVKDHGLTMPILIDKQSELSQSLQLIGTPMHVLIDAEGRVVHKGHEANSDLDNKIAVLTKGQLAPVTDANDAYDIDSLALTGKGIEAILFTVTWCDWYLKDTRPNMSKNCSLAPHFINQAQQEFSHFEWRMMVSRLWTGEKDLNDFKTKYEMDIRSDIDESNASFIKHKIQRFPTLIIFKNGKEISRIEDFINQERTMNVVRSIQKGRSEAYIKSKKHH